MVMSLSHPLRGSRQRVYGQELRLAVRDSGREMGPKPTRRWGWRGWRRSRRLGPAIRALGLTARSWHRVIRVARTIADLDARERIERADLSEALTYRVLEERRPQGRPTVKRKQTEVSGAMVASETPRESLRQEVAQCRPVE